jgi:hypothetical protein
MPHIATVHDVKCQLECLVGVPVDLQIVAVVDTEEEDGTEAGESAGEHVSIVLAVIGI